MPWKKRENSFGIGKGGIWLWLQKRLFKDQTKALCINITKSINGTGLNKKWDRVGTLYLEKEDVVQLIYELSQIEKTW